MILRRSFLPRTARMFSTVVGQSGRKYVPQKVIHCNPSTPMYDLKIASCEGKPFILKSAPESTSARLQAFNADFRANTRLRNHIDYNEKQSVFVYEFYMTDLLDLMTNYPEIPIDAKKTILKEVALALNDMHAKGWAHLDVKPDNIFLNWTLDDNCQFHLQKVVLGDMDIALKLGGQHLNATVGTRLWRSPEMHLGRGVGMPSDVFSFGLLSLFTITGAQVFHTDSEALEKQDASPETAILLKLLDVFGPLPDGLVKHVNDQEIAGTLRYAWNAIVESGSRQPFDVFTEETLPNLTDQAKRLISSLTNLDPGKRPLMSDVIVDPYWASPAEASQHAKLHKRAIPLGETGETAEGQQVSTT